ncbi:MAG: hypothetical protein EKK32_15210 [Bradyrhizobiaceae bacterium]|nr:MAG: hypothetical protein EKK32_15210 [Bradyrhizobiaceae bacterium]
MPRLVLGLHAVRRMPNDVDGRDKPGHDDVEPDRYKTLTFYAGRPPPRKSGRCRPRLPQRVTIKSRDSGVAARARPSAVQMFRARPYGPAR